MWITLISVKYKTSKISTRNQHFKAHRVAKIFVFPIQIHELKNLILIVQKQKFGGLGELKRVIYFDD